MAGKIKAWLRVVFPFALLMMVVLGGSSCQTFEKVSVTEKLWRDVNPKDRVWIPADKITEDELKKRGVEYKRITNDQTDGFLVHKSSMEKLRDYSILTLATPITVAVDAAGVGVVVGAVAGLEYITHGSIPINIR